MPWALIFIGILLKSCDFIGFSQCPMGRGSGGPPSFSQNIPVGFHSEINLSAKGMRKIENGEKFLRFRDRNLKHLPACGLLLRFRGESKKVVWGYMTLHRDRKRHRKVGTAQNWFYYKTQILFVSPPSDSPPSLPDT